MIKKLLSILVGKIKYLLDIKQDTSVIPEGFYCYYSTCGLNTKLCPYYKQFNEEYNGCAYLGIITDNILLWDMCKICGENLNESENDTMH